MSDSHKFTKNNRDQRHKKRFNKPKAKNQQQNQRGRVQRKPREYPEGAIPPLRKPQKPEETLVSGISGNEINDAFTALFDAQTGKMVSFDEAVELIKQREQIHEDETLLYGGRGEFIVVAVEESSENPRKKVQVVRRRIAFENYHEDDTEWRVALRYDFTKKYEPKPYSLSSLYTDKEISEFPLNKK